jgi:acetyl-CoA C-acetyltransferase
LTIQIKKKYMSKVFILSATRTPIGSFGGKLAAFSAVDLGIIASKAAIEKAGIDPAVIQEVYYGNVVQANLGQAPSRQMALGAGIPYLVLPSTKFVPPD